MENSGAAIVRNISGRHGEVRGLSLSRRSSQFEGRFGRMFRSLCAAEFEEDILMELGAQMTAAREDSPTAETEFDDEENAGTEQEPGIAAGYTYLGQFIDHDLTFDPVSSLQRQNDPDGLTDYRTPRFDLDNLYGRGPDDQPYLYRPDGRTMLLGEPLTGNSDDPEARDVPRISFDCDPARAIIGDPRNDENVMVSQLQASMLRFHNRMAAVLPCADFECVQRMVRWHYQWVILHDFLPMIVGRDTVAEIMGHVKEGETSTAQPPQLKFFKSKHEGFMPIEFSVAAYRYGHSMVRPLYRLNQTISRKPIFANNGEDQDLRGFRAFPREWAIDWRLFFPTTGAPRTGPERVQPAYKIDTSLVNPLGSLPPTVVKNPPPSLAQRNLLRGWRMQLPSGQAVAEAMGYDVIPDGKLKIGKATKEGESKNKSITQISDKFKENAPLWFYILSEAQQSFVNNQTPIRLGKVGGRIVGEVFIGLMLADSHSYLRQRPNFKPREEFLSGSGEFRMSDLLQQAKKAST
jgi:heme peroxidase